LAASGGPAGLTAQSGSTGSLSVSGSQYNITTSQNAFLNWTSFNVGKTETVNFIQPSATSIAWNTVNSSSQSTINGTINANGVVVLINKSGFTFGADSHVNAAGFVASTAPGAPIESNAGLFWQFTGPAVSARIVNYGVLSVANGGSLFLIANHVENRGTLNAPGGSVGLAAGSVVQLSERADGRGLSAAVTLPSGTVDNYGQITADAGVIALQAQVVNQNGLVQANSVAEKNGVIELVASDSVVLGDGSSLSAQDDGSGAGAGGQITVRAANNITVGAEVTLAAAKINLAAASGNIELKPGLDLTLADLADSQTASLKLEAAKDILFDADSGGDTSRDAKITAGAGWSLTLEAGRDFSAADKVVSGTGNITLASAASIETQDGDIKLLSGNSVTVNGGFIRTKAGGNIDVQALSGDVNTGTLANGFKFYPNIGYLVDDNLGGISTANGGNVSIAAGRDVISFLPVSGSALTDAGSGAFGAAAGNVSIQAGRDVIGHYVVRNGLGTIVAGRNAGADKESQLALSLVSGGWTVTADNSIYLQEARNPNGIFNSAGSGSSATKHHFDYSQGAFVTLIAKNAIHLLANSLPRASDGLQIDPIYPGTLTLSAGSGGIFVGSDITLFPSPVGNLTITTTGGGSLVNTRTDGDLASIVVSDSDKTQYKEAGDFGVPQDYAEAYFWLDVAASGEITRKNRKEALKRRDEVASHLTPSDLSRVQERARKWWENRPSGDNPQ